MGKYIATCIFPFLNFPKKQKSSFVFIFHRLLQLSHLPYFKSLLPSASRKQNGLKTPSECNERGGRKRFTSSDNSVARCSASKLPLAKSTRPAVGRAINPTAPLPNPLKNPSTPSLRAPLIG